MNDLSPRKILFLGDRSIGKTTLIRTYCDFMRDSYNRDIYNGSFLIFKQFLFYEPRGPRLVPIQLLDLPAGTTVESRQDQYPAKVHSIALCFAIDNPDSLANICQIWLPECRQYYSSRCRINLFGLRSDYRKNKCGSCSRYKEPVASYAGRRFHQQCGFNGFYLECSAQENLPETITAMNLLISKLFH